MHLNPTWQCIEGRQRTKTKCTDLIDAKSEEILVTFTSFFLRDGCLSSSSRLEIFAVNIGSATDLSVLRWRIFTFFHFCKNKTSIWYKNKAKVWSYLSVMQSAVPLVTFHQSLLLLQWYSQVSHPLSSQCDLCVLYWKKNRKIIIYGQINLFQVAYLV